MLSLAIKISLGIRVAREHDTKTNLILPSLADMGFSSPSLLLGILLLVSSGKYVKDSKNLLMF